MACLGRASFFLAGVRSPPLREMAKGSGQGLPGANRGTARRAVFSEGRALRVRVVPPSECGGISFPPDDEAKGPRPKGDMPRSSPCHLLRACRARPSARWPSDGDKAFRGQTGGQCEGRFSRRDALCASVWYGRPNVEAFHFHPMTRPRARGLRATCRGQARAIFCGRAEPAPPRDGLSELGRPSGANRG